VPAVSALINNAGIGAAGRFLDASLETWRRTIDVNVLGVVHGCRAFVPAMIAHGQGGQVVNIASAAGLAATRDLPVYSATKFAVVGLSHSLRADLAEHAIGVTCVCPGIIDTPIVSRTRYEGAAFTDHAQTSLQRLYRRRSYSPAKVARAIVDAVQTNPGVLPVTPESWAMWLAERVSPGLVARLGGTDRVIAERAP
jgi:NAD(P)-dependent dehydrogenase (short-subunit alcohol dehydrogenase family)